MFMPSSFATASNTVDDKSRIPFSIRPLVRTFAVSMAALYFELLVIRYIGTEIRVFAYLKNIVLIAGFCGIGIGMVLAKLPSRLKNWLPLLFALLFLSARYSQFLGLTHIGFVSQDDYVWGMNSPWAPLAAKLGFVFGLAAFFVVMLFFFIFVGSLVGVELKGCKQLSGYSANLAGSLAGMLLFTAMSFYETPPAAWIVAGCLLLTPFVYRQRTLMVTMLGVVLLMAIPQAGAFWSPYYRIDLSTLPPPPGWKTPAAHFLAVNHDYHQKAVDLSPDFVRRYPDYWPNNEALRWYDLPYNMIENPGDVLVVGAGTGNDVAAALRHGARHVDAVEIDPVIARLGRQYHPERPYDSPKVAVIINDARAFFNRADRKYDLIVFGHLDSHTLMSSFSSLRLDNFVYTSESFRHAKQLLKDNGSMFVAFASGKSFVTVRQFATLTRALGSAPTTLITGYDTAGVLFVYGKAQTAPVPPAVQDVTATLTKSAVAVPVTTDAWPFPYLPHRTVPIWTLLGLLVVWICIKKTIRNTIGFGVLRDRENAHFFLLGAGFLLLETNAITKLSLLYGSTWVVNAVVISAFLIMALAANMIVVRVTISRRVSYVCLALALAASSVVRYDGFSSSPMAALLAGFLIASPVFFSGLIFSTSFRNVMLPASALGINMLGAVLGGLLENLTMIGGALAVSILAFLIYAGSAVALKQSDTQVSMSAMVSSGGYMVEEG
jgi:SAM-dependent methyltransferase